MEELVLITGINGFIGRQIAERLMAEDYRILGLSIEPECFVDDPRVKYEQADITDHNRIETIFSRYSIQTLIHLAAIVHKKGNDLSAESYKRVNYQASEALFSCALRNGVKNILFASTIEVYGPTSQRIVISEDTELHPETDYGKSKMLAEESLVSRYDGSFRYAVMRFAPVYAEDFRLNMNKRIYLRYPHIAYVFKHGDYSFHFCSIFNICNFVSKWIKKGNTGVFNVADGQPVSATKMISLEKKAGRAGIVLRMPFSVCYGMIWLAESMLKLIGKKDSMLSVYNYNKLFQSVQWDIKAMKEVVQDIKWNVENTLFTSREDRDE